MARRQAIISKKIKPVRTTKTEQYLINHKYLGEEPDLAGKPIDDVTYAKAMTWYNYMCSREDAREYLDTYLVACGRVKEAKMLHSVSDTRFPVQAAWIARMLSRGASLGNSAAFLSSKVSDAILSVDQKSSEKPTEEPQKTAKIGNIQDRIKDKVSDVIGEFEEAIDVDGFTLSMYEWLTAKEIPALLASKVADFYRPIAEEAAAVLKRDADDQLLEGYAGMSKEQLRARSAFYAGILADCVRFASNTKAMRQPRKPKTIKVDKKIQFVKPLKESKEFKIASIQPEKILGAQELWMLNTKYKTITVFYAIDRGGLDVYRTAITKYDETRSGTYRAGRNTENHIATILSGGKRATTKLLTELKKTDSIQERINENTILMKVL